MSNGGVRQKKQWLAVLNEVYQTDCSSLEALFQRAHLYKLCTLEQNQDTVGLATLRILGNALETMGQASDEQMWQGGLVTQDNEKSPVISKGSWICQDGSLCNRYGSTIVVPGFVPRSILISFMEWQPGAAKYGGLSAGHTRMKNLFPQDGDLE